MHYKRSGFFDRFKPGENQFLFLIVLVNFLIKAFPAALIELGNDEVYYWTYALFPDWSHFDHPPMVGLTIQLFSLNLLLHSGFFIRLGALVLSSLNILLLFKLVKRIYSLQAAYFSSFLFTASVYFNVISGLFILPDTPQIFFILLALYFGLPALTANWTKANREAGNMGKNLPNEIVRNRYDSYRILLFGLFTGLAFLCKYHALFLWVGFGLYILIHDRSWLKKPALYFSVLLTLLMMIPVVYWNVANDFISFTFHGSRVGVGTSIHPDSFLQFNLGQFFYQNPILSVIYLLSLIALFKKGFSRWSPTEFLLIYLSLPLIVIFTLSSLFKDTFPHWTGPAFIGLIILSSGWLSEKWRTHRQNVVNTLVGANALVILTFILAIAQINYGVLFSPQKGEDPKNLGNKDVTLDMYGWSQSGVKFQSFLQKQGIDPVNYNKVKVITHNWFPAAHVDLYVAHPMNIDVFVYGTLERSHKYYWINKSRNISDNDRIFYLTSSQDYTDPTPLFGTSARVLPVDTLPIERNGRVVKNLFVFELKESKEVIDRLSHP